MEWECGKNKHAVYCVPSQKAGKGTVLACLNITGHNTLFLSWVRVLRKDASRRLFESPRWDRPLGWSPNVILRRAFSSFAFFSDVGPIAIAANGEAGFAEPAMALFTLLGFG